MSTTAAAQPPRGVYIKTSTASALEAGAKALESEALKLEQSLATVTEFRPAEVTALHHFAVASETRRLRDCAKQLRALSVPSVP